MNPIKIRIFISAIIVLGTIITVLGAIGVTAYYPQTQQNFNQIPFQKGMSFTTWGAYSYNSTEVQQQILQMKQNNIEWVAANIWWFQDNLTSTKIESSTWSDTDANITAFFNYVHSQGMKILFKPMLDSKTGQWRSDINASDAWFAAYDTFMVHMATLANKSHVEILSIGCEMGSMQVRTDNVITMISDIRAVYNGLLTYAANHDSFWYVNWWDKVDIIGIDSYFPFTMSYNPSVQELSNVWNGFYDRLAQFSMKWNKPIMFTEFGAQARKGANMVPNDDEFNLNQDVNGLQTIYESLFASKLWTAPWFKGIYWWMWDCSTPNVLNDTGFTPKLPAVLEVVAKNYGEIRVVVQTTPKNFLLSLILITGILSTLGGSLFLVKNYMGQNKLFQKSTNKNINNSIKKNEKMY